MRRWLGAATGLTVGVLLLGGAGTSACGGDDDECLVEGENCTTAFVEKKYGDGRGCCSGLTCKEGTSGILVCKR